MELENLGIKNLRKSWRRLSKNLNRLIIRDTLDFLDFKVDLKRNLSKIINDVNKFYYSPQKTYLHPTAKSKGISRATVIFSPEDSLIYRFCIEQIEDDLVEAIRKIGIGKDFGVYGGFRIKPKKEPEDDDYYERWFEEWINMQESIFNSLEEHNYLVKTDIASYYENINLITLRDLVRSEVKKKREIVNLLFFLLESVTSRFEYETNTFTGLPQEDIDCSRILAYFFLNRLDLDMKQFCLEHNAKYYRWIDDINIVVKDEIEGKQALKTVTESLRKVGLTASIEKTEILSAEEVQKKMFREENDKLQFFIERINLLLFNGEKIDYLKKDIEDYYKLVLDDVKEHKRFGKNWEKVMKRFYTLFTLLKSGILLPEINSHLVDYTEIVSSKKLPRYLIRNKNDKSLNMAIKDIIDYLYSRENLYPQLESNLLETFLYLNISDYSEENKKRLKNLCEDIFFKKNEYKPLSDYSRAISLLLYYRFNKRSINNIAKHYLSDYSEDNYILKKYLIFISLTSKNINIVNKVIDKAKKEQHYSINRLVNFIENLCSYKNNLAVSKYLENKYMYVYKNNLDGKDIKEEYNPIRVEILEELIQKYSK